MNFVEDKFNIYINIEKNIGDVTLEVNIYESGVLLLNIDTKNITSHQRNISIFDGQKWTCIDESGTIDTSLFKKLCINFDQIEENKVYNIDYNFKLQDTIVYENSFDYSTSNELLQQEITIPILIYNKTPKLFWKNSHDLDGDQISYELNIFDGENTYSFYIQENLDDDYSFYQLIETEDFNIKENTFYFWKVRASDGIDNSEWSNLSCFFYINRLEMQLLLCKKEENDLQGEIYVKCDKQLLDQSISVRKYLTDNLYQSIYVSDEKQLLNQRIDVINGLHGDLNQSVFVTSENQHLNFSGNVVKKSYSNLEQSIFVKADNQLLFQQIAICSSNLSMKLWCVDTNLRQKINVKHGSSSNLNQTLKLRGFSRLDFKVTKVKKIESNLKQTLRVQLPYYEALNILAEDQNGIKVLERDWISGNKTIYFSWNQYQNGIYYKYTISMNGDDTPDKTLHNNSISFTPPVSGIWFLKVRAYLNNNPIHENDSVFVLYINNKPTLPQQPFMIDGNIINENTEIYNTLPEIKFNGAIDVDNDILKYHIKISKTVDFAECYVDTYVDHQSVVTYQLKPEELLPNAGLYFLYIATCDYTPDGTQKSEVPIILQFRLSSILSALEKKLRVYYYSDSALLFMKVRIPRTNDLYQKITVSNYLSDNINMRTRVYKNMTSEDLLQEMSVYKAIGLNKKITVYHNYSSLNQSIFVNKNLESDLNQKIRVYHYNLDNFTDEEIPDRDVYQKVMVYNSTDNPNFTPTPLKMQIMVAKNFFNTKLDFSINVWNMYNNPYYVDLSQKIIVSNIVAPPSGILFNTITVVYEQPPNVIVSSNIPENTWQKEYQAVYNFLVSGNFNIPVVGYYYEFDNVLNTIPDKNSKYTTSNSLRINFKDYLWRGRFYLHVRAINTMGMMSNSTTTYCILYNLTPSAPSLPLLVNGYDSYASIPVINYTRQINFTWGESYDPDLVDNILYKLQITDDPTFKNIIFEQSSIVGNFYGMNEKELSPSTYYWRVLATDGNENSNWSLIGTFFVNANPDPPKKLMVKNIS